MNIVYGTKLNQEQEKRVMDIAFECGILYDTARLLYYREQDTVEKAKRFLSPGKHGLHNPFLLADMDKAVERLGQAKIAKENILIFGDYDADGVCASSLLYFALKEYGITNLRVFVPEREQGYGLNVDTLIEINEQQKIDLIITVDCGISDYDKILALKQMGIDVIVTDHHEPPDILPDCIKINPKITGQQYPFNGLCGAGVSYKLANALIGEKADKFLDLVAVATVADSMDLVGENRDVVSCGLDILNGKNSQRLAFKYLLGESDKQITAQTIAYSIAPRINAGGRMGDAKTALDLFTTEDENAVFDLSVKLNGYNMARQAECDKIYNEAKQIIKKHSLHKRNVILVKNSAWSAGFIGIVASKLVEDFARPVIVFAGQGENLKGSARSIDGINIYDAITSAKDLLLTFGGHSQAAGVSITEDNFIGFEKAICEYVSKNYGKIKYEKISYAEWDITDEISLRFAREIELLEPFGVGNKRPTFTTTVKGVSSKPLRAGSPHYSFNTSVIEMLDFNGANNVLPLSLPVSKKVLFEINLSTFKGRQSIKGYTRTIVCDYGDFSSVKTHVFVNEIKKLAKDAIDLKISNDFRYENNGAGTVYILSNAENYAHFKEIHHLPLYLFRINAKNNNDCVVISPMEIPEDFERVVYLDVPLQFVDYGVPSQLISNQIGYEFIKEITTDRSEFIRLYNILKSLTGKVFTDTATFVCKHSGQENPLMLAFVIEVFMELGIFVQKNGIFSFDEKVKNALTNSTLYSKIELIKAQYV